MAETDCFCLCLHVINSPPPTATPTDPASPNATVTEHKLTPSYASGLAWLGEAEGSADGLYI